MSDEKIAEIRERHARDAEWSGGWAQICPRTHDDRATLLAEVDRQARHIDELRAKVDAEKSCACSYDAPGDICAAHSPALMQERTDNERLRAENERLCNEDTKTRHALKGWAFVCPDGGADPTHERVAAVVAEVERLREALSWYADQRNHFPVERRNPGDPDPAVIFLEEPPIMIDGGKRARKALEGKP